MSQWTHVCGCIRYDALRMANIPYSTIDDIKKLLGNTVSFEDSEECWNKCNVPYGSEGSIQFSFWVNPSLNSMAAYTVAVFGDLRDFGPKDVPQIEKWFEKVTKTPDVIVRNAILEINIDNQKPIILEYEDSASTEVT